MEISTREQGGGLIVTVVGRLDTETSPGFEQYCNGLIGQGHRKLVLDLSRLVYISSAGLRAILASAKRLRPLGGGLGVCSLTGVVAEVFAISGFAALMPVVADVPTALERL